MPYNADERVVYMCLTCDNHPNIFTAVPEMRASAEGVLKGHVGHEIVISNSLINSRPEILEKVTDNGYYIYPSYMHS